MHLLGWKDRFDAVRPSDLFQPWRISQFRFAIPFGCAPGVAVFPKLVAVRWQLRLRISESIAEVVKQLVDQKCASLCAEANERMVWRSKVVPAI